MRKLEISGRSSERDNCMEQKKKIIGTYVNIIKFQGVDVVSGK
jgi:hypothetical protein